MARNNIDNAIDEVLWTDRKRIWCGLPWTFTTYTLTGNELIVKSGILSQKFDNTQLYRIVDTTLTRSLVQRIFGLSTITIDSMDRSTGGIVVLKNIRDGFQTQKTLQQAINVARSHNSVRTSELYGDGRGLHMGDGIMPGDFDGDGIPDDIE